MLSLHQGRLDSWEAVVVRVNETSMLLGIKNYQALNVTKFDTVRLSELTH